MSIFSRRRAARGFTLVELIVVMAILAIVVVVVTPFLFRALRRQKLMAPVREIYSLVLATRMQAARRNQHVIMFIDQTNRQITTWADNLPYNYVQDPTEPTINSYSLPANIYFARPPSGVVDGATSIAFDTYNGNGAFVNLIIFRGDGTLLPPTSGSYSDPPLKPGSCVAGCAGASTLPAGSIDCNPLSRCRGIFISDSSTATGDAANRNVFRISVDDFGQTGKVSLLKWISTPEGGNGGENNFAPCGAPAASGPPPTCPPWNWN
jgi:prepilin-type N-terminal cleavage/methylation domain-containing protein